jgi:PBP1b-binding outer membrane lipoprotein LpoB
MKRIILLFIAILIFGCSKDSDSENNGNVGGLKLIKIVETDLRNNSTETINFTYTNGVLSKSEAIESNGNVYKTEYIYENGKLKSENHFDNLIPSGTNTFTYTGNIVSSSLSFEDNQYFLHTYAYNSSNKLINAKQFQNNKLQDDKNFEHNSMGNMTKIIYVTYNNYSTMEYDNYKNPYSLIYSEAILNTFDEPGYSKNNVTRFDGVTYEYIYNSNNYPVVKKCDGVSKTTYTYQ